MPAVRQEKALSNTTLNERVLHLDGQPSNYVMRLRYGHHNGRMAAPSGSDTGPAPIPSSYTLMAHPTNKTHPRRRDHTPAVHTSNVVRAFLVRAIHMTQAQSPRQYHVHLAVLLPSQLCTGHAYSNDHPAYAE
ncbi:unnamed protein product [Ectocarpus sp. 4 AP-2014]